MITIRMSLLRMQKVCYDIHKADPDSSIQKVDYNQVIIDIQSIFTADKILKNAKEKAKCTIRLNGLTIPKINRAIGIGAEYFVQCLIKRFEHGQKREQRKSSSQLV